MPDADRAPDANLLRYEASPYLLQHAGNPVHWRPWGAAALAEARAQDKPILLSIGYAACHWCHVMAHESFEDPDIAALMNRLFVNIKVDREERPDVDHLYMSALHALGEQGGWPLTMFLDPDGAPFWGGTYFPPQPGWGRPSFRQVLSGIGAAYAERDERVIGNAGALRRAVAEMGRARPGDPPGPAMLDDVAGRLLRSVDPHRGGLIGAPKFPNTPVFRFLWQHGGPAGRAAVHGLLRAMSDGGIYDHLGGGYARYSTDAEWLVPHFEKMLYDNAQILDLLALAQADCADPLYVDRAAETVAWMQRDMASEGAFAASEDADSEGEEGRFYVWTAAEIDAALTSAPASTLASAQTPAERAAFCKAYDVTPHGNWEGRVILRRVQPRGTPEQEAVLARARAALLARRATRVRPGRDDKLLADWNGLAIAALVRAASVFDQPAWLDLARSVYAAIRAKLIQPDGRVAHAWRNGRITAAGLLDDQAALARAALALFEVTGEAGFRDEAAQLASIALQRFADRDGSVFMAADDATDLPAGRPRSMTDNATPSGVGLLTDVCARLFHLTGDTAWRHHALAMLTAHGGAGPMWAAMPTLLSAARMLAAAPTVVVTGAGEAAEALVRMALRDPDPLVCVLRAPPGQDAAALADHHPAAGKPRDRVAAYVCRNNACGAPVFDPDALQATLRGPA